MSTDESKINKQPFREISFDVITLFRAVRKIPR